MRIKMLQTRLGSENGYDVHLYQEGKIYEVGESLAASFLRTKSAQKPRGRKPATSQ